MSVRILCPVLFQQVLVTCEVSLIPWGIGTLPQLQRLLLGLTGILNYTVSFNWEENVVCLKSKKINYRTKRQNLHRCFPLLGSAVLWAIERVWLAAGTQFLACSADSLHQYWQESQDKETSFTCLGPCVLIKLEERGALEVIKTGFKFVQDVWPEAYDTAIHKPSFLTLTVTIMI